MSIQQSFSFTYILMARTTTDLNQVPGKLYYTCAMSVCNLTCLMKEKISLKSNKVSSKSTEQFRRNCTFFGMDRRTGWIKMIAHFSLYEIIMITSIYKLIKKKFSTGVTKKLEAVSKKKSGKDIQPWIKSINNHIYWVSSSCGTNQSLKVAKWLSITNHICNQHEGHSDQYDHEPLTQERKWLQKGKASYCKRNIFKIFIYIH